MTIDAAHGVVSGAAKRLFAHRNLLDAARFEDYLRDREGYVQLSASISGGGDSLTFDDSTVAAANGARTARRYGHSVTIFVNGHNIERAQPYCFSRLNVALDEAKVEEIEYDGQYFDLKSYSAKQYLRMAVKKRLARLPDEDQRQELVTSVARLIGVECINVPSYLQPMTKSDLAELIIRGVDVQNHGWTHSTADSLSPDAHAYNIWHGREWLKRASGVEADLYAVPNGEGWPPWDTPAHYRAWFMLDESLPLGEIAPTVFNRRNLSV